MDTHDTTPENGIAEGLVEFLQATAPQWATKLTQERMTFVRIIAGLEKQLATVPDMLDVVEAFVSEHEAGNIDSAFIDQARAALREAGVGA